MRVLSASITNLWQLLRRYWRLTIGLLLVVILISLAFFNRTELLEAFETVQQANLSWIALSVAAIFLGYFITSQVLVVALRSMGYRLGILRIWAMTLVAVVLSQLVPGGGVGSYAFLVTAIKRRGVPSGKATLAASLETISYVTAMLLIFLGSMVYLTFQGMAAGGTSYIAALVAMTVIGLAVFILTRSEATLTTSTLVVTNWVGRLLRRERNWADEWVRHTVQELVRGRLLLIQERRNVVWLIPLQITGLLSHSLAMLLVLRGLNVETSFFTVVIAFGVAMITSTFNILPGGGGTVEAALITTLGTLGVGAAAIPAAIIFRLLNFWILLPVSAVIYYWLMHERPALGPDQDEDDTLSEDEYQSDADPAYATTATGNGTAREHPARDEARVSQLSPHSD